MKTTSPRVLIADDQPDVMEALRLLVKGEGYQIEAVNSPAGIMRLVETREFDVVLMDLNYARDTTSGQEGLDVMSRIHAMDSTLPVIVMTAWGSIELAVEAMRRGARDFVQKPWENARLLTILRTQIELCRSLRKEVRLEAENQLLRAEGRPALDRRLLGARCRDDEMGVRLQADRRLLVHRGHRMGHRSYLHRVRTARLRRDRDRVRGRADVSGCRPLLEDDEEEKECDNDI